MLCVCAIRDRDTCALRTLVKIFEAQTRSGIRGRELGGGGSSVALSLTSRRNITHVFLDLAFISFPLVATGSEYERLMLDVGYNHSRFHSNVFTSPKSS